MELKDKEELFFNKNKKIIDLLKVVKGTFI